MILSVCLSDPDAFGNYCADRRDILYAEVVGAGEGS